MRRLNGRKHVLALGTSKISKELRRKCALNSAPGTPRRICALDADTLHAMLDTHLSSPRMGPIGRDDIVGVTGDVLGSEIWQGVYMQCFGPR